VTTKPLLPARFATTLLERLAAAQLLEVNGKGAVPRHKNMPIIHRESRSACFSAGL
jgi:hypothetical protein